MPHHVQRFFHHLYEHLLSQHRLEATLGDVDCVYQRHPLSVRGQVDLAHYEERLRMILGDESYTNALSLLSEAAVNGGLLTLAVVELNSTVAAGNGERESVADVLYVLEHDGYLQECNGG